MRKLIVAFFLIGSWSWLACDSGTRIKEISPNFGNVAGNDTVVLIGSGFKPGMEVRFGKREARSVVLESSSRIIVKTPSGIEGKVDVILTRDDGKTFVLREGFIYQRDAPNGR